MNSPPSVWVGPWTLDPGCLTLLFPDNATGRTEETLTPAENNTVFLVIVLVLGVGLIFICFATVAICYRYSEHQWPGQLLSINLSIVSYYINHSPWLPWLSPFCKTVFIMCHDTFLSLTISQTGSYLCCISGDYLCLAFCLCWLLNCVFISVCCHSMCVLCVVRCHKFSNWGDRR